MFCFCFCFLFFESEKYAEIPNRWRSTTTMDWPLKWDDLLDSRLDLRTVGPELEGGGDYDGTDVYPTTTTMAATEEDEEEEMAWLSSDLLSYQPLLNDCMLSQMSNVPMLSNSKDMMFSACSQSLNDQEFEQDLLTLVNPNMAMMLDEEGEMLSGVEKLPTGETMSTETCALGYAETDECLVEKKVQVSLVPAVVSISGIGTPTYVVSCIPSKNSLLKPQMITLPSRTLAPLEVSERLNQKLPNLSKVQIRVMTRTPAVGAIGVAVSSKESSKTLPLSPPNSDSDGSVSPVRSERLIITQKSIPRNLSLTRPKITNHVSLLSSLMPSSGSLFLSEEEEHTLISEGYPVPTRWPLTKQEEKILKKIQRKIKNKVSAQESRRKKKDYIDSLEKRLEASNLENSSLKKKVEKLEHGNRAIKSQIEQLKKAIQSMSTQTSTCIMAFVLFFALLLGALNPLTVTHLSPRPPSIGLSEVQQFRNPITSDLLSAGPQVTKEISDYKTPNMKSRILLSVLEDPEVESAETPGSVCSGVLSWLSVLQLSHKEQHCEPQPEIIVASAIPLIVEIHGQNPVRSSLENQTEAKIGVQKPDLVDSIYLADFVTIPASES